MTDEARVDTYIAAQADFARPILTHVRTLVQAAHPDVTEAIKWGFPHFLYKTKNLASMAAFKSHAAVNLWYSDAEKSREGMGHLGKLTSLTDLPCDDELRTLLTKALALIDAGAKPPRMTDRCPREPLPVPPALTAAIAANPAAATIWSSFPPGKIRDYCEWIIEAKTAPTRDKRIAQAIEWIAQGKSRNWKYEKR